MATFHIGFLIYPGITQLDFTGPFEVLGRLGTPPSAAEPSRFPDLAVHVVARTLEPVFSDRGLGILPSRTFETCPPLSVLCVPGGAGLADAIADPAAVDFVLRQSEGARYVTSVCVGSFLLGAAGVLKGRRAATHWAYTDLLPLVGAQHVEGRVVRDGNIITSTGVSAGIDFAFEIVAELAVQEVAEAVQLGIEYDPAPPFDAGHPDKAPKSATELMVQRNEGGRDGIRRALQHVQAVG